MGDLISRQAAIDTVMEFMPSLTTPDGCGQFDREIFEAQEMFVDIGQALNKLPSAQPERKKGKWIPHEDEDGEHYGDKCSECGEWYVMPYGKTNFCPNCGADMRADRYDSLQFAIKLTIKRYKKQIKENTEVIDRHSDPVSFCAIRVGEISALKQAIEDMEKWV